MGDGWETRRRRGGGNDWVIVELATFGLRWFDLLPAAQAVRVLVTECGAAPEWARGVVDRRPLTDPDGLAKALEGGEPHVAARVRDLVATAP
ncbi:MULTISPECIES: hypothetical protein [Streptomyces]|uniref:hypothetical protein n=1 Tax=Streptomyces lycopersici TaxID=2974589 RepID=UPI003523AD8C